MFFNPSVISLCGLVSSASAEPLSDFFESSVDTSAYKLFSNEEKEAEIAAAEAEAEANKDQFARVIVLRWQGTTTDQKDVNLQRNVRSAIEKSDALFLPAIDLFQDGREIKDETIAPELQPAEVSDEDIDAVMSMYRQAQSLSYEDVDINEWQRLAMKYRKIGERIWFVDRPELREPLFLLYTQIGRAAEYTDNGTAPLFEYVGGRNVNYYYYLAATMVYDQPELLQQVTDPDSRGGIEYYVGLLQRGVFPSMKIDFQMEDKFDLQSFNKEYEVLINGVPVEIDSNGELDVFLGRSDIYLKRKEDGIGLTDRLEAIKTEDKAYRVLELARKRMEVEFIRQLFLFEEDCSPQVDSDILTYLSIYTKMHPEATKQIFIAVPKAGNPNKVWVWRFDASTTSLKLVQSGKEEFPVHFVGTMGTGALYNGATISVTQPDPNQAQTMTDPTTFIQPELLSANVPFSFDLRAHYTKFMVQVGVEYGMNLNEEGWTEYYQTPGMPRDDDSYMDIATVQLNESCLTNNADGQRTVDSKVTSDCTIVQEVYHTAKFSKHRYVGFGYLFGRDASFGYGLRTGLRFGHLNMPNSFVTTAHLGYTYPLDQFEINKRVKPILDADIRAGTVGALPRSLAYDLKQVELIEPIFGFTLSAGTTF